MKYKISFLLIFLSILLGLTQDLTAQTAKLRRFYDANYPDYPMTEYRHEEFDSTDYATVTFRARETEGHFDVIITPVEKKNLDTVTIRNVNLLEFMPSAPAWVRNDAQLTQIALQNQEWNRQQVMFLQGKFEMTERGKFPIRRVDLVNNCLGAGLWEIQIYAQTPNAKTRIYYHGWFDFPKELYQKLFDLRHKNSNISYRTHGNLLENWVNVTSPKPVAMEQLRKVKSEKSAKIETKNDEYYQIANNEERKFKFKNIIFPTEPTKIQDFLTNKTQFASFEPPGIYVKSKVRPTELGRLATTTGATIRAIEPANGSKANNIEIDIALTDANNSQKTRIILGGINFLEIPKLEVGSKGVATTIPFGISNHALGALSDFQQHNSSLEKPYYALFLDGEGRYLDHHNIGVDATVVHIDLHNPKLLHIWLLSYERHCWVGHFTVDLSEVVTQKIVTGIETAKNINNIPRQPQKN